MKIMQNKFSDHTISKLEIGSKNIRYLTKVGIYSWLEAHKKIFNVIKEMKIEITMRYHYKFIRIF